MNNIHICSTLGKPSIILPYNNTAIIIIVVCKKKKKKKNKSIDTGHNSFTECQFHFAYIQNLYLILRKIRRKKKKKKIFFIKFYICIYKGKIQSSLI